MHKPIALGWYFDEVFLMSAALSVIYSDTRGCRLHVNVSHKSARVEFCKLKLQSLELTYKVVVAASEVFYLLKELSFDFYSQLRVQSVAFDYYIGVIIYLNVV